MSKNAKNPCTFCFSLLDISENQTLYLSKFAGFMKNAV